MDKQIMDLSNSQSNNDFIDLMYPQEDRIGSRKKEEIVPSYGFQPIRQIGALQQSNLDSGNVDGTRVWNSADSKTNTTGVGIRNYSSLDSVEPTEVVLEKVNVAALVSEIDQTMKKHADNLLHALEGFSARISQLESRTRNLENSVDDLKVSVENNHGSTNGKLRQMENIFREVIRDNKQDILEGQLHLAKLQVSKVEHQSEPLNAVQSVSLQQAASAAQLSHQQLPPAIRQYSSTLSALLQAASAPQQPHQQLAPAPILQPPTLSLPNAPPPASRHNLPPSVQLPNQFPPNPIPSVPQRETYFPPQTQETMNQQYQLSPPQHLQPPVPAPPHQQYQPPPHPRYSQPSQLPQQHPSLSAVNPPQPQPSLGHHSDEAPPYAPPQNYPPSLHQPPHPPSGNPPSQQFYGTPSHMYEPPSSRPNSGYSTAYGPSSGANEPYPYSGAPSQDGSGSMKQQQLSSAAARGGGTGYPQHPTAHILPHAMPTASGVGGGSHSAGTDNRVPIDDVVNNVATMGFPRDQVRATVRKLTESGQSVDLNIVLDKLMNDSEGQPQRGWFDR